MTFEIRIRGQAQAARCGDGVLLEPLVGSECWKLVAEGKTVPLRLREREGRLLVTIGSDRVEVEVSRASAISLRRASIQNGTERFEVRAPMPGLVVAVPVASGEPVKAGGVIAIVEAMKMQMEVVSPASGHIEEIRALPGQEVAGGQVMAVIRASASDRGEGAAR